ncbi:MAG TPA: hypothetical protein VIF09_15420, partial [Polyangiaceae bacterium]
MRGTALVGVLFGITVQGVALAQAGAPDLRLAPGESGALGAWLVSGPFDRGRLPDEEHLAPRLGPSWKVVASDGLLNLAEALDSKSDRFAYAGGVLHVTHGGRHTLLVGADDGVAVLVDGKRVFARDEPRPQRDDDDLVALDLAPGDHTVVLALHQYKGAWSFRVRLL